MAETVHPTDPHHVVCVGDALCSRRAGATETLERICRVRLPDRPWKFWHQGEVGAAADAFREEAIWRALGLGAGRLLLSLGSAEVASGQPVEKSLESVRACMDLLSDKGPRELWLVLPAPSLWPLDARVACGALREGLAESRGRWNFVDPQDAVSRFLEAQSVHPDLAVGLMEDSGADPVPTATGAQLLAERIFQAWTP
jgi:hypothetical protein